MTEGFTDTQLAGLANITMGQSPGSERYNNEENGLPFLQGCAEFGPQNPEPEIYCHPPLRIAKQGSILISVRAPVGTMNMADQDYCIGRGLSAIQGIPGVAVTPFLRYAIMQNAGFLHRRSQGSTFLAIGLDDLKRLPIPKLDINIQERIAEILETVGETIEKTKSLIAKYQQIKAGLMHDLFTRGVTADGKLRPTRERAPELYKETAIGWIPKEWETGKIGDLFNIQLGKMLSKASKTGKLSVEYLGNKNVQWDKVDLTNLEEMDFLPAEREKFRLISGDLLVCEGGDVGRTAIWNRELEDCYYQKAIHRLRPKDGSISPRYVLRYMRHAKDRGFLSNYTSQTSIAHLTQEQLSKVRIAVPSQIEQELVCSRFDNIDLKLDMEQQYLLKLKKQKSGLMHDLLTGRVRVPASETKEVQTMGLSPSDLELKI